MTSGATERDRAKADRQAAILHEAARLFAERGFSGVSLEELFARDQSAVPMVVYQCMQAVDLFGLEVEGIYRTSGTASHVNTLRDAFNHNAPNLDFRNPANFHHDVSSVATLLKQFFRDLPDPLFTSAGYDGFINAARVEDPSARRDALHQQINDLPDPNYATLRALVLHLDDAAQVRVREALADVVLVLELLDEPRMLVRLAQDVLERVELLGVLLADGVDEAGGALADQLDDVVTEQGFWRRGAGHVTRQ